ncbi:MAG: hypothetical protein AB1656_13055 [Candidatus Omnitrophota bacterium]
MAVDFKGLMNETKKKSQVLCQGAENYDDKAENSFKGECKAGRWITASLSRKKTKKLD